MDWLFSTLDSTSRRRPAHDWLSVGGVGALVAGLEQDACSLQSVRGTPVRQVLAVLIGDAQRWKPERRGFDRCRGIRLGRIPHADANPAVRITDGVSSVTDVIDNGETIS